MTKAIAMISGGLDSLLAAKLIKNQGIEVIGVCFRSYFFNEDNAKRMTAQIDIPLEVVDFSEEHLEIVRNPKHGHGKNMNPCIDCHAMMMRYSGELLKKFNADFIITGEVLNQRPMSQNKGALQTVKKESGVGDKILRPLCAKNLDPTEMELSGLVDREQLLDIKGRTRTAQIELAEKWGIVDYPSPAGGCKLTEPNYSKRLKITLENTPTITKRELELLKIGRHFRVNNGATIISTRTADEAKAIKELLNENDTVMLAKDFSGSMIAILSKNPSLSDIEYGAKLTARYSKGKDLGVITIKYGNYSKPLNKTVEATAATDEEINTYII